MLLYLVLFNTSVIYFKFHLNSVPEAREYLQSSVGRDVGIPMLIKVSLHYIPYELIYS